MVLGGGAFSHERNTPVGPSGSSSSQHGRTAPDTRTDFYYKVVRVRAREEQIPCSQELFRWCTVGGVHCSAISALPQSHTPGRNNLHLVRHLWNRFTPNRTFRLLRMIRAPQLKICAQEALRQSPFCTAPAGEIVDSRPSDLCAAACPPLRRHPNWSAQGCTLCGRTGR